MRVLLNATTAAKGGSLHLSTMLVRGALRTSQEHQWCFAVTREVKSELEKMLPEVVPALKVFHPTPARSRSSRRDLARLEIDFRPDCIFTPYGPAYVRFRAPHLLGMTVPWVAHPSLQAYQTLDFPHEWVKRFLEYQYKSSWFRCATAWWVETESSRQGLIRRLKLPGDRIVVVPNTCGQQYREHQGRRAFPDLGREVRLLYFAAAYNHKNLNMVPRVARALADKRPGLRFRMVTTLPEDHFIYRRMMRRARKLQVTDRIDNRGRILVADGPRLYQDCDVCFMPTLLEVFSATYPEAMAMGLPIVTSDLPFARDVCGDAAIYFRANDPASAAQCLLRLLDDSRQWGHLLEQGKRVLDTLPTPEVKFARYMSLLAAVVEGRPLASPAVSGGGTTEARVLKS